MTNVVRGAMVMLMAVGTVMVAGRANAQDNPISSGVRGATITEFDHVRSRQQGLRAMIATASEQSSTFRRMVETINASDGIVYVAPGVCRPGVRACLVKVTPAGRYRFLFVKVDVIRAERELIAAIGHELRHAIEVLSDPAVTDSSSMLLFYMERGVRVRTSSAFETVAAIEAGATVADEIRRFQSAR